MDARVLALVMWNGDLYAGGSFTNAGGVLVNKIAKWDGNAWSPLGSGINGVVLALAASEFELYVAGIFTQAGAVAVNEIARWTGDTWWPLGSGLGGAVYSLAFSGTDLYAGGAFSTAGGAPASHVAKYDGLAWTALGSGVNNPVYALSASATDLFVAGPILTAGGKSSADVARAAFVIPASPPVLVSPSLAAGVFSASFSNAPGVVFRGFVNTNANISPASWAPAGQITEPSPGLYQFTDPHAASPAKRLYRVQWP